MEPATGSSASSNRLAAVMLRRGRRALALLVGFATATLLLAVLMVWRISVDSPGARQPPPANEYVIFFLDDLTVLQQVAELRRHPQAEFIQTGKLPGVAVVRFGGDVAAGVRALRQDAAVFRVEKSVAGMVCH